MKTQIIQEKENPLFKRKEVQLNIEADVTPSKKEVAKILAEKFKTQEENIVIKKIHGKFGSKNFKVTAHIYASREDKDKVAEKDKKSKIPSSSISTSDERKKQEIEQPKEEIKKEEPK